MPLMVEFTQNLFRTGISNMTALRIINRDGDLHMHGGSKI